MENETSLNLGNYGEIIVKDTFQSIIDGHLQLCALLHERKNINKFFMT
jgi:hypothetical protein